MAKSVLRTIHNEIKHELHSAPSWVSDRVEDFATKHSLLPFLKYKPKTKLGGTAEAGQATGYTVTPDLTGEDGVEELGRTFQEFYIDLEEELMRRKWRLGRGMLPNGGTSVGSSGDEKEKAVEKEKDAEERDGEDLVVTDEKEKRMREILEIAERTLCSMFYDRYASLSSTLPLRLWSD